MRSPISIAVLLLAFAPAVMAQSTDSVSLGDVARQSRAHAVTPKKVFDDQNDDFGRADDNETPCGSPIASLPSGYVSSTLGKPIGDEQASKALLKWLDKHPDLDLLHPEDLARLSFPHSATQNKANQQVAAAAADRWLTELGSIAQEGDPGQLSAAVDSIMSSNAVSNANSSLTQAVQAEQQRRVRSDGSSADKLQEATNLYSICESRRQVQFQDEVNKLAKDYFQKRVSQLAAASTPAKQNPAATTGRGM
jgi:hypothetical protein